MLDAKLLPTYDSASGLTLRVYGVWIPRRGDNIRFTVEVVANQGATMLASLYEKNYNEAGDGSKATDPLTFSSTGRQTVELLGAKELVRLELELTPSASDAGRVLYRVLHPVWFENVKA